MNPFSQGLVWWITAIDLPAMAGLFWLIWRTRRDNDKVLDHVQTVLEHRSEQFRDALNAFKLEVAKGYASRSDMRDLESRLVGHLLRIEAKLDSTALKAESLKARED